MFRRLKKLWAEVTDRETDFPPPALDDPADAEGLLAAIRTLDERNDQRHLSFLLFGAPLKVPRRDRPLLQRLAAHGLASEITSAIYTPTTRLFRIDEHFFATDLLSRSTEDQVFSLMFEQVYLVRNMDVRIGDEVLELCVGSGVNSIVAAGRAARVTAVDLSPRALAFARFNAALNGRDLELLEGSLFAPVAERRFDLVVVNPPFELVPEGESWFLHSHGGEDGLDVIRELLAELPHHLAEGGRLEMITWAPAGERGSLLVPLLQEALPGFTLEVHELGDETLDDVAAPFRESPGYDGWRARLTSRGIDRVQTLFVRAAPGEAGVTLLTPTDEIEACHQISDDWI